MEKIGAHGILENILKFFKKYGYFITVCLIFVVGIFYRTEAYLSGRELWLDETLLANNFFNHTGYLWVFKDLSNNQIAPGLFLFSVKILTVFFGYSEYVLKFIPYLGSIISIPVFYIFSKKILEEKTAIILANTMFGVNFLILRYACEFKQYGIDILFFMIALMIAFSIKINTETKKSAVLDILKYGFIFTVLFFASQPTIFVIAGYVLYSFLKNIKNIKNFLAPAFMAFMPFCFALFYKIHISKEVKKNMQIYWHDGFIDFSNFLNSINMNTDYFINHNNGFKFLPLFVLFGFIVFIFRKSKTEEKAKIKFIILSTLFIIFLLSVFKIYPLHTRIMLYFLPLFIIFISLCFDFKFKNHRFNKILSSSIVIAVILFLCLFQLKVLYPDRIYELHKESAAGTFFKALKKEIAKEDNVHIVMLPISKPLFDYYSKIYGFDKNKVKIEFLYENQQLFLKRIKTIKSGDVIWFYGGHIPTSGDICSTTFIKMAKVARGAAFQNTFLYKLYF